MTHASRMVLTRFRAFSSLTLNHLAQVNLLVGTNNSGKTSVLEAIELAAHGAIGPFALARCADRRGEYDADDIDIAHLFHEHQLQRGRNFQVSLEGEKSYRTFVEVVPYVEPEARRPDGYTDEEEQLGVLFHWTANGADFRARSSLGALKERVRLNLRRSSLGEHEPTLMFVSTASLPETQLARLWDEVVLTPNETRVVETLRLIEPSIERVAFLAGGRSSVLIKLKDIDQRIPLSSMGDGMHRLLAIVMSLIRCQNGFFLIDEVDTGFHYSVMREMWRVVLQVAQSLNIQVFATTHSLDCVRALAWATANAPTQQDVSLYRLERGQSEAIHYNAEELQLAAAQHLEVRG